MSKPNHPELSDYIAFAKAALNDSEYDQALEIINAAQPFINEARERYKYLTISIKLWADAAAEEGIAKDAACYCLYYLPTDVAELGKLYEMLMQAKTLEETLVKKVGNKTYIAEPSKAA